MTSSYSQNGFVWLIFAVLMGGMVAYFLVTGRSWWWGKPVSRAERSSRYWSGVLGAALPALLCALVAFQSFER